VKASYEEVFLRKSSQERRAARGNIPAREPGTALQPVSAAAGAVAVTVAAALFVRSTMLVALTW